MNSATLRISPIKFQRHEIEIQQIGPTRVFFALLAFTSFSSYLRGTAALDSSMVGGAAACEGMIDVNGPPFIFLILHHI